MKLILKYFLSVAAILTINQNVSAKRFDGNALRYINWADSTELTPDCISDFEACLAALQPGIESANADTLYLAGRFWHMAANPYNLLTVFDFHDFDEPQEGWPIDCRKWFAPAYENSIKYFTEALRGGNERARLPLVTNYALGWRRPIADLVYFIEPDLAQAEAIAKEIAPNIPAEIDYILGRGHEFQVNHVFFTAEQATPHLKNALRWYERGSALGDDKCLAAAAEIYLDEPFNSITQGKAATDKMKDRAWASYLLASYYASRDKSLWLKHMRKAADGGYVRAEYVLGEYLAFSKIKHRDYVTAAKYLEDVAVRGEDYQRPRAHYLLGHLYERGRNAFTGNYQWREISDMAAAHFRKSIEIDDWMTNKCRLALGTIDHSGGCEERIEHLKKIPADASQYPEALYHLCKIYSNYSEDCTDGSEYDLTLQKLKDAESPKKYLYLGMLYKFKNPATARNYFEQAIRECYGGDQIDAWIAYINMFDFNCPNSRMNVSKLVEERATPKTCEFAAFRASSDAEKIRYMKKALELYEEQGDLYYIENGEIPWTPDEVIFELYWHYEKVPKLEKLYRNYADRLGVDLFYGD